MKLRRAPLLRLAACLALATAAQAQTTWVVGPVLQPGVDFTEIQPAVNVAGPLDLIYVLDGDYAPFETDHGVTVMGESRDNVRVSDHYPNYSSVRIHDLVAQERVVLTDMTLDYDLYVEACDGLVLVDNLQWYRLHADAAEDVRLQSSDFVGGEAVDSFVQVVGCSTLGGLLADGSEVTIAGSSLRGRHGRDGNTEPLTGLGPPTAGEYALNLIGSTARVLRSSLQGGEGGIDWYAPGSNAPPGPSLIAVAGSSVTESRVNHVLHPPWYLPGSTRIDSPDFPCTLLSGGTTVGATVSFQSFAGALTSGRLFVGRYADKTRLQTGVLPRLHTSEAGRSLGAMPASELVATSFTIPQGPKGYLFFGQTWRTLSDGQTELSNSAVLVVR